MKIYLVQKVINDQFVQVLKIPVFGNQFLVDVSSYDIRRCVLVLLQNN